MRVRLCCLPKIFFIGVLDVTVVLSRQGLLGSADTFQPVLMSFAGTAVDQPKTYFIWQYGSGS